MKCSYGGCHSYAINHHLHGRDGTDGHLCDVCFWRSRATDRLEALNKVWPFLQEDDGHGANAPAYQDAINAAREAISKAKGAA